MDPQASTLVLDTSSQGRADEVVTLLIEGLLGFALALLDTQTSPQAAMAHWLMTQEPPAGFTADRETELKAGYQGWQARGSASGNQEDGGLSARKI